MIFDAPLDHGGKDLTQLLQANKGVNVVSVYAADSPCAEKPWYFGGGSDKVISCRENSYEAVRNKVECMLSGVDDFDCSYIEKHQLVSER